jgi:hypothetical protein
MSDLWKLIQPYVVQALGVLVPLLVGLAAAMIRKATERALVRRVVSELDQSDLFASGADKKQQAVDRLTKESRLTEAKASQLIEAVLPQVRRESDTPPSSRTP